MILQQELPSGRYMVATTRKSNYSDHYFGKYTLWKNKAAFDRGDCHDTIVMSNIYLGLDPNKGEMREIILQSALNNELDK